MLDGSPPDPELILSIYRDHIHRHDDPKIKRNLDRWAAEIATENDLDYTRVTEDPSPIKFLRKLVGKLV
jgi:hypothetical protein